MIGIALMGAGRMARVHAKAIGAAGGRLVTVYDVVESAAKSLASDTNASVAHGVEEALQHPDVDAVLFIDAQDTDATWADNFSVSKATIRGQQATVQVNLNGKEMKYKLLVTLRRENGVWKIDNVKGSD